MGLFRMRGPTTGMTDRAEDQKPTAVGRSVDRMYCRCASVSTSAAVQVRRSLDVLASVGMYEAPAV
jgi:hypothetical protein